MACSMLILLHNMRSDQIQSVRGTYDILPQEIGYRRKIENVFTSVVETSGFKRIETPALESKDLFIRSVGEETDIISKELFGAKRLNDPDEETKYVLRPEGTAGIVRAYIEKGLFNVVQPAKLYYLGPFWRYERPQAGRFRQFYQAGIEIIGDDSPEADAYAIMLVYQFLQKIAIAENLVLEINTIGDVSDRPAITKALKQYFEPYVDKLPEEAKNQYQKNILRILDSKDPEVMKLLENAPQIMDLLSKESHCRFKETLEMLDELDIPYALNPRLVRGFDYYTHLVFEIRDGADEKRQSSLAGGGRYNTLVKDLGGPDVGAVGFAIGIERVIEKMKQYKVAPEIIAEPKVYVIQIGEKAKKKCLNLIYRLNEFGISSAPILGERDSLRSQLKYVDKMNAPIAIIIGQKEAMEGSAIIRNMRDGVQETVDFDELVLKLQDSLGVTCN